MLAWLSVCLDRGAVLHMAQLMPPTLTLSCFNEIQIGFTILVPAHLGSPGKRAVKRVCVCVCVCLLHGAQQRGVRRANAGSATLSAYVVAEQKSCFLGRITVCSRRRGILMFRGHEHHELC